MERVLLLAGAALAVGLTGAPAPAQDTGRVGVILPCAGQFADTATQGDNGIKLDMQKRGDTVVGTKIGRINPPVAKRLAQGTGGP